MHIQVTGRNMDIGDALRAHIEERLTATSEKYFSNPIEATVVVSKQGHLFRADISVHVSSGVLVQGHDESHDAYAAFDSASDRIGKRLRRYKRKLKDHSKQQQQEQAFQAQQYILATDEDEEDAPDQPVVVAEMPTHINTLGVSDAVMLLELGDLPVVMFRNGSHGELNIVYRRKDGNIGWIDPHAGKKSKESAA